jgi:hypothetical protein
MASLPVCEGVGTGWLDALTRMWCTAGRDCALESGTGCDLQLDLIAYETGIVFLHVLFVRVSYLAGTWG